MFTNHKLGTSISNLVYHVSAQLGNQLKTSHLFPNILASKLVVLCITQHKQKKCLTMLASKNASVTRKQQRSANNNTRAALLVPHLATRIRPMPHSRCTCFLIVHNVWQRIWTCSFTTSVPTTFMLSLKLNNLTFIISQSPISTSRVMIKWIKLYFVNSS